uniref:Long-chain-fatty-acid--CoA ligase n=1 Tax=uncultured bacterium esnapd17 TaxID=1366598 RepID=S5TN60_9BACT|nr:long-chain-fatty-acid--CoA ligase [uncultured bacterium esnapd17]
MAEIEEIRLSRMQEQLWFAEQLESDATLYTESGGMLLSGPLDVEALAEALRRVVERHEILRTVIAAPDGQPVMRVLPPPSEAPLERLTLPRQELAAAATEFVERDVDLETGPLFRALLVELGRDEHAFVIAAHHLVCDATGSSMVLAEMVQDYTAIVAGRPSPVPEPELQYGDYAVWEREVLAEHAGDSDETYWRDTLRGADTVLELPLGGPRPAGKGVRGERLEFEIADDAANALIELCRKQRASTYLASLAAFAGLLHLYTGKRDLLLGTLLANRDLEQIERTVGQFANTVPLRLSLHGDPSFTELVRRLTPVLSGAQEHGKLGFGRIVQLGDPARDPSRNALVQHLFLPKERTVVGDTLGADVRVTAFEVERTRGRFDTISEVEVAPGRMRAWVEFDTELFRAEDVAQLMADYGEVVRAWVAQPHLRLSQLLGGADLVLVDGARQWTGFAAARDRSGHPLLARLVARTGGSGGESARSDPAGAGSAELARLWQLGAGERVLLHRDFAHRDLLVDAVAAAGAGVVLTDGAPADVAALAAEHAVTVAALRPENLPALPVRDLPKLRTVAVDGPVPYWLVRYWAEELDRSITRLVRGGDVPDAVLAGEVRLDDASGVRVRAELLGLGSAGDSTVPPEAVAAVLRSHPLVQDVRPAEDGFAVTTTADDLDELLRGRLPRWATPPTLHRVGPAAAPLDADDPLLAIMLELWAEVLQRDEVRPDDDFFALGGHSMLSARLTAQIQEALQVQVPLRTLFENSTPASLVGELRRLDPGIDELVALVAQLPEVDDAAGEPADGGVAAPTEPIELPLFKSQLQLWLMEQLRPGQLTHTVPLCLTARGPVDPDALRAAVNDVVARQQPLRSTFHEVDGEPRQRIVPELVIDVPVHDVTTAEDPRAELERRKHDVAHRPVDITDGPLMQAELVRYGTDEYALLLLFHHLVTDEVSMTVFMRELSAFYAARVSGEPVKLPPLTVDLATLVREEQEMLTGQLGDTLRRFWTRELTDAPELELPTDHPRPDTLTFDGEFLVGSAPRELFDDAAALAKAERTTAFTVFLAATLTLLRQLSGQEDIVVGVPSDNRFRPGSELLMGCFLNVLPLRVDCSGDPTFQQLLGRVRDRLLDVYDHQRLPVAEIIDTVRPTRVTNRLPLFQVTCELQLASWMPFELPGCEVDYELLSHETARYDMAFHGQARDDQLSVALEVNTNLWDRTTGLRRIEQVVEVLRRAVADPSARISTLAVTDG